MDPCESRRKNIARGLPDGQGSILHHSVPMEVMLAHYGTDDMGWLIEQSDRPDTVRVERIVETNGRYETKVFHLPAARFDNRVDHTSFLRQPRAARPAEAVTDLHRRLAASLGSLALQRRAER